MKRLAIIGAGSWGTALSIVLASRFPDVRLWVYEPDLAERIRATRENDLYLPGVSVPENVRIFSDLPPVLEDAEVVLSVVPSHLVRAIYEKMLPSLTPDMILVSATKGIDSRNLRRPSEIILDLVGGRFQPRIAVLSGPSFAGEVARLIPTAIVIGSVDASLAACVQAAFSGPTFRLYTSADPVGIEIAAATKNVVAIGAGVIDGMGLGHNALAALITRGLAEMTRLAMALGGQTKTLSGLAGLGDLVLTCTGELSRNRAVGVELARGRKLEDIVGSMRMVAEGIKTTSAAVELARRHGVEMPITEQMYQMLHHGLEPREAVRRLMERGLKGE